MCDDDDMELVEDPVADAVADVGEVVSALFDVYGFGVSVTVPVEVDKIVAMVTVSVDAAE